jgi:hypothetical protein
LWSIKCSMEHRGAPVGALPAAPRCATDAPDAPRPSKLSKPVRKELYISKLS